MSRTATDIEWNKTVTRPLSVLKITTMFEGLENGIEEKTGIQLENHLFEPVADKHAWYTDAAEMKSFMQEVIPKNSETKYFEEVAQEAFNISDELISRTADIRQTFSEDSTNEELLDLIKEYHDAFKKIPFLLFGLVVLEDALDEQISKQLEAQVDDDLIDEYYNTLTTKVRLIDAEREERELLQIKADTQEGTNERKEALEEHAEKYGWLPKYDHDLDSWGVEYFSDKLVEISDEPQKELENRQQEDKEQEEAIEEVLNDIGEKKLRNFADTLQDYLVLRTYRTDAMRQAYYNVDPLLQEIGRRMGFDGDEYAYLRFEEILNYLREGESPAAETVRARKKKFLLIKIEDEVDIITDESEISSTLDEAIGREVAEEELSGSGTYEDIVEGTVKIVESPDDEDKLEEGDVLVSSMTTPEMHSMIEKAEAIVTDEGGVTSHAAIVSRELEIPCVIGTGNATMSLNDGDMVRVNSKDGLVTRIE